MTAFYILIQWTWGFFQSLLGAAVLLRHRRDRHFHYHGAAVTVWKRKFGLSLGMFIFVPEPSAIHDKSRSAQETDALIQRLLVHEYGHTIQSLMLGPLYLLIVGIPSALWATLPAARRKRAEQGISYFSFFTERWADQLGAKNIEKRKL